MSTSDERYAEGAHEAPTTTPGEADLSVELVSTERTQTSTPTSKVVAATAGAGVGSVLANLALWALGVAAWGAGGDAQGATEAVAAVPWPVAATVLTIVPAGFAFVSGYVKRSGRFEVVE